MQEALTSAEPPAVGMIGLFSNAYLCVDAAVAAEMENDLQIVAFDFEEETLAYMDQGFIQVTHAQRQYYMGYLIPYIILAADVIGLEETKAFFSEILVEDDKIHTGLDVVQTDQLEEYNQFLESLGIS
jgi:ribose transport system substrate-binding protein